MTFGENEADLGPEYFPDSDGFREFLEELKRTEAFREVYCEQALGIVATRAEGLKTAKEKLDEAVFMARQVGATWKGIGEAVGMTPQSAHGRWKNKA